MQPLMSRMYYVDVNRLRTLWKCCVLVSVHEATAIRSLHCCLAIVFRLTDSWQTVGLPFCSYGELCNAVRGSFYDYNELVL